MAARDIAGGTVLDQDMLRVEAIPSRLVTPSIVRSDLLASVQDAKLLLPMKQGDLLNFNMLQGTQMSEALSQDLAKGA